ncbi:MAG TPA: DinB family protein [Terriglobales bacterium]|nr:DinB family protein [Terriglobales bacterium]
MSKFMCAAIVVAAIVGWETAIAQEHPLPSKTIPDSLNLIWKSLEQDFTALAEAMPEKQWSFRPTQGAFANVRTFEQVKHVAYANKAWAKQIMGEKPPERCDLGGPNSAKTKAEILAYLRDSFRRMDEAIVSTNANNLLQPVGGP